MRSIRKYPNCTTKGNAGMNYGLIFQYAFPPPYSCFQYSVESCFPKNRLFVTYGATCDVVHIRKFGSPLWPRHSWIRVSTSFRDLGGSPDASNHVIAKQANSFHRSISQCLFSNRMVENLQSFQSNYLDLWSTLLHPRTNDNVGQPCEEAPPLVSQSRSVLSNF